MQEPARRFLPQLRSREWIVSLGFSGSIFAMLGTITALWQNLFFIRMTPVRLQDYIIWIMTGILAGLIVGTYTLPMGSRSEGKVVSGGLLSFLAIGCPICNKMVLLLLGTSGALNYFAPAQLYIGIASLALLGWALYMRVQAISRGCSIIPEQVEVSDKDINKLDTA